MPPTPTPLPFPGDEIRAAALFAMTDCEQELIRLQRLFRGHHKSTTVIDSILVAMLSHRMSLIRLLWDPTVIEDPTQFDLPPTPAPAHATDAPQPTPPAASDAPSALQ